LRFHPRSKGFHGDVSAGGFALLQILGDELGDWEVGKLETAIGTPLVVNLLDNNGQ
jgi:hypothetical protein